MKKKTLHESNKQIQWHTARVSPCPDYISVGIVIYEMLFDNQGIIVDLIIKYADEEALKMIRQPLKQIENKKMTEIFGLSPAIHFLIEKSNEVLATEKSACFQIELPFNHDCFLMKLISHKSNTLTTVIANNSKRNMEKECLYNNRELLENIIESIPSSVFARDLSGHFTLVNNQMAKKLKVDKEQPLGKTYYDFYPQETIDALMYKEEQVINNQMPYEFVETMSIDGETRTYLSTKFPLRDSLGNIQGIAGVITDITDRIHTEEALREANNRLLETDHRKNQFLAILSHELRNPLALIQNCLCLLDCTAPQSEKTKHAKEIMERQVTQLSHLVNDLLDITRITQNKIQLQLQKIEINEMLQKIIEDNRLLFDNKEIDIKFDIGFPIFINADVIRFEQIIGNLLHNAAKFTRKGDCVSLTVENETVEKQVSIRVIDTGIGMTSEMVSHLFQPFMQADTSLDRSLGGLGLGLALVRELIELHGGQVTAYSEGIGKGSEFKLTFPINEFIDEVPIIENSINPQNTRRILIIDDNKDFSETLSEMLKFYNHQVEIANSGPEGLWKAKDFQPQIIICDIGLPGMNGYEVAKAFRLDDTFKDVHLLALTGYATPGDLKIAFESGFDQHLAKPVDLNILQETLLRL